MKCTLKNKQGHHQSLGKWKSLLLRFYWDGYLKKDIQQELVTWRSPTHGSWERKLVQGLWQTGGQFLETGELELPGDSAILPPGVHLRQLKTDVHTETRTQMFTAVLLTTATRWKKLKHLSVVKSRKTKRGISIYYLAIK